MALETEVKFLVSDLNRIERAVLALGGKTTKPRVLETNTLYDDPAGSLSKRGEKLRLRSDTRCRLTFKRPLPDSSEAEFKVREELEVEVSDHPTMERILERLGYSAAMRYEKYRTTMTLGGVELVLDEMPFGLFVELEGEPEQIREAARALALDWEHRIVTNYTALFEELKRRFALPFRDMTFTNFERASFSWDGVLTVAL